jgi:predicted DNA-binding transcriptional regulator AlpA
MRPKVQLGWPLPGEPDRLVGKVVILIRHDFSPSHFERVIEEEDAPPTVRIGLRARRWWASAWDDWARRRQLKAPALVPTEPPPAEESKPRRRRRPRRPRKTAPIRRPKVERYRRPDPEPAADPSPPLNDDVDDVGGER